MAYQTIAGHSGARAAADADQSLIFGPHSESNVSRNVEVGAIPIVVRAFNLQKEDVVLVEMVDGDGAGTAFVPFCPFNGQSSLTYLRNVLPIGLPGRYRFVLARVNDKGGVDENAGAALGYVTVRASQALMSHEWLSAYLKCGSGS